MSIHMIIMINKIHQISQLSYALFFNRPILLEKAEITMEIRDGYDLFPSLIFCRYFSFF